MQDFYVVTGMVISQMPVGEFDRRVCILTREKGKITAFAKGARRPGSKFMAATNPFSFGKFKLYEGKSSYNIMEVDISRYFEELRQDYIGAYVGMYFLEVADYYTRENNDEKENQVIFMDGGIRSSPYPALRYMGICSGVIDLRCGRYLPA